MYQVSLFRHDKYDEGLKIKVREALEKSGCLGLIVSGMKVAIKPNLLLAARPQSGATTHPEMTRAVAQIVREQGAWPYVCESPGGPALAVYTNRIKSATGYQQLEKDEGLSVTLVNETKHIKNVNYDENSSLMNQNSGFDVLEGLADADLIIDIAKPKPHGMMGYSGAVKNMFGAISGTAKFDFHNKFPDYRDFANLITDIYDSLKPQINILDGIVTMHKRGPSSGEPIWTGLVAVSRSGYALDYLFCKLIGVRPEDVLVLKKGQDRGVCPSDVQEIDLCGDSLDSYMISDYVMPKIAPTDFSHAFGRPLNLATKLVRPKPVFDKKKCVKCAVCIKSCPAQCLTMGKAAPKPDLKKCIRCFCCEELCSYKAIEIRKFLK